MTAETLTLAKVLEMLATWGLTLEQAAARGFPGSIAVDTYAAEAVQRWVEINLEAQLAESRRFEAIAAIGKAQYGEFP